MNEIHYHVNRDAGDIVINTLKRDGYTVVIDKDKTDNRIYQCDDPKCLRRHLKLVKFEHEKDV